MSTADVSLIGSVLATITALVAAYLVYKSKKDVSGDKTVDEETQIRAELRGDNKDLKAEVKALEMQNDELKKQNQLLSDQNNQLTKVNIELQKAGEERAQMIGNLQSEAAHRDEEIKKLTADIVRLNRKVLALEGKNERKGDNNE